MIISMSGIRLNSINANSASYLEVAYGSGEGMSEGPKTISGFESAPHTPIEEIKTKTLHSSGLSQFHCESAIDFPINHSWIVRRFMKDVNSRDAVNDGATIREQLLQFHHYENRKAVFSGWTRSSNCMFSACETRA